MNHGDYEVNLKRVRLEIISRLEKEFIPNAFKYEWHWDWATGALLERVRATLLGERQHPVVFQFPSSWWQHFKRDVLRMKNVKMRTTKIDVTVVYPRLKISLPNESYFVSFRELGKL